MKQVTILIVTGNIKSKVFKNCIKNIKRFTNPQHYKLVVFEAGISPDFNHAREINKAIKILDSEYLILIDDDVIVSKRWLEALIEAASLDNKIGIVGAKFINKKGELIHTGATVTKRVFGYEFKDDIKDIRDCDYVTSAVMLIKKEVIQKIGFFDENLKKYGQDADFGLRAKQAGFRVVCTPKCKVIHLGGATFRLRSDTQLVWEKDKEYFYKKWKDWILQNKQPELSKRGVVYPTFGCNLKCGFCYYIDEEPKTKELSVIINELNRLKYEYDLEYVDITGGEPTIYKYIREIIQHCKYIGLKPTIITNAQISSVVSELISLGLEDILISIHGYNSDHDRCVGKEGAYNTILRTIELLKKINFSFRTNTTLLKYNYKNLPLLADKLIELQPRIVNFIAFNPHEGTKWSKKLNIECQEKYSEIAPYLVEAIDKLMEANIWVNVRYFPLCILKGYEKHICNFHQWQWDPYEWEYKSGFWLTSNQMRKIIIKAKKEKIYGAIDEEKMHLWICKHWSCKGNIFLKRCRRCKNYLICDGIYPQYYRRYGDEEFKPIEGELIKDPLFYRRYDLRWNILEKSE